MRRPFVAAMTFALLGTPAAHAAALVPSRDVPRPAPATTHTGARVDPRGSSVPSAPRPAVVNAAITGGRHAFTADSVVVEKALRRLTLYSGGLAVRTFDVALGQNPVGAKERIGDFRTPEGLYAIDGRNPFSRYHKGLHISYPNAADLARAQTMGVTAGGDVMIHGLPNGEGAMGSDHRAYDWTNGCVAVTDDEIDEIWNAVPVGTPVRIKP
ncbi:hypothetical protein tb265_24060 [Gemmatimonadetes bacterium T265]|nr:hypothetical protein tb265_24060 [Gemmatimonadetes bacterium T265]